MTDQQLPVSPEVAEAVSTTPALTSASTSAGPTTFATPTPTLSDEFAEQWYHNANSTARAVAEGVEDPFKAYEMPQIPAGYVVGTAAVLGGGQGEFGNEGEGRDSSNDKYLYEVVRGFFKQNDKEYPRMSPEEMLASSFGLIDTSPERWENLKTSIQKLRQSAPENVQYKVLFCGRHGEGHHNLNAARHDAIEWEFFWARKNGDSKGTWGPDAELTTVGEGQALAVQEGWKANIASGAPKPETFWVSPLTRTANTMRLSFGDLLDNETPLFVERLREIYGVHTCDKRRSKSYLAKRFPGYDFEPGFAEEDPWWHPEEREQEVDRRGRMRKLADKLFDEDVKSYVSLTSHSCALRSLMAILNHDVVALETGEMIPIVVKATRQK